MKITSEPKELKYMINTHQLVIQERIENATKIHIDFSLKDMKDQLGPVAYRRAREIRERHGSLALFKFLFPKVFED